MVGSRASASRDGRGDPRCGRKNFKVLRDRMDAVPERRKRVEELKRAYKAVLALADLRESRGVTQAELAGALGVSQPNVSKLEGKGDIRLSTLGGYVAALGGRLEVRAVFPDHPEHDISVALPAVSAPDDK